MKSFFAVNPAEAIKVNGVQYVDHIVVPTDTMQGLALKYGVKVTEIKT